MIPSFAVVQVESGQWRMPRLWLPVFLLWIPALLLAPVFLLVVMAVCAVGRISPWRAIVAFWGILSGLPGTHVHVRSEGNRVLVRIL